MKKHKISIQLFVLSSILFMSGCGIFSLHPLYHNEDLVIKPEIAGTWQSKSDKDFKIIIETQDNNKYEFVMIDKEDTLGFEMGLIELNDQYFIDLYPLEDGNIFSGGEAELLENLFKNYIPAHTFMKFDFLNNEIALTEFDNERLIELFQQNKIRLAHEQPGEEDADYVVITAKTDDIQKFISRYANEENAFNETENYYRL